MAKEFLTKAELVSEIAKKAGLKKADAEKALEAFIER
jgi:Bacterial DNA-binding protein.